MIRFLATLTLLLVSLACHAGDVGTIRGQSTQFSVTFADPMELPTSVIEILEWDGQELAY